MRLSPEVEIALSLATSEAARRRHEFVAVEHLLFALMFDDCSKKIVRHAGGDGESAPVKDPLKAFTLNLNDEAAQGRIDPIIGRENEISRAIQILCRRRKNNPLLIGDAGVGKTAIAEGLAWKIQRGEVPAP